MKIYCILGFFILLMKMCFCAPVRKINMEEKHTDISTKKKKLDYIKENIFLHKLFKPVQDYDTGVLPQIEKIEAKTTKKLNIRHKGSGIKENRSVTEHKAWDAVNGKSPREANTSEAKHIKLPRRKRNLNLDLDLDFNFKSPFLMPLDSFSENNNSFFKHHDDDAAEIAGGGLNPITDILRDIPKPSMSSDDAGTGGSFSNLHSSVSPGGFNPTDASNQHVIQILPADWRGGAANQKHITIHHENDGEAQTHHVVLVTSNQNEIQQFDDDLDDSEKKLDETENELKRMLSDIVRQIPDDNENSHFGDRVLNFNFGDVLGDRDNVHREHNDEFSHPDDDDDDDDDDDEHGDHDDDNPDNADGLDDDNDDYDDDDLDTYDAVLSKMKMGGEKMTVREMMNLLDSIMKEHPTSKMKMDKNLVMKAEDEEMWTADTHLFDGLPLFEDLGSGIHAREKAQSKIIHPLNILSDIGNEEENAKNNDVMNDLILSVAALEHVSPHLSRSGGADNANVKITQASADGTEQNIADIATQKDRTAVHISHQHGSSQSSVDWRTRLSELTSNINKDEEEKEKNKNEFTIEVDDFDFSKINFEGFGLDDEVKKEKKELGSEITKTLEDLAKQKAWEMAQQREIQSPS